MRLRALISGPASVSGTATCDATRVATRLQHVAPRRGPGGSPGRAAGVDFFFAIYALIYAPKLGNKVRLNASRTSKRRLSCLGMSWRRKELITLTPEVRSSSYSMLRELL